MPLKWSYWEQSTAVLYALEKTLQLCLLQHVGTCYMYQHGKVFLAAINGIIRNLRIMRNLRIHLFVG